MNAVYINKNNPKINFGQTGEVFRREGYCSFLPHGGDTGITLCNDSEIYFSDTDFRVKNPNKVKREVARKLAKKIWAAIPDRE